MPNWRNFDETAAGTNAGAIATHAAATGVIHKVTHISGHTDADAFITVRDGDETGTVLWEVIIDISVNGNSFAINVPDGIMGVTGNAITGYVSASSADCHINISGQSFP